MIWEKLKFIILWEIFLRISQGQDIFNFYYCLSLIYHNGSVLVLKFHQIFSLKKLKIFSTSAKEKALSFYHQLLCWRKKIFFWPWQEISRKVFCLSSTMTSFVYVRSRDRKRIDIFQVNSFAKKNISNLPLLLKKNISHFHSQK